MSQEKLKTMLNMQNFGRQTKFIVGDVEMDNRLSCFTMMIIIIRFTY